MAPPKKVNWWYESLVDWMLEHPEKSLRECAERFNVTAPWLSTVLHSDAFKAYKQTRMADHQTLLTLDIVGKTEVLADLSLDVLSERIERNRDTVGLGIVRETAQMALKALGYSPAKVNINAPGARVSIGLISPEELALARGHLRDKRQTATPPKEPDNAAEPKERLLLPAPS